MTSTLPNFLACSTATPAASVTVNSAALAALTPAAGNAAPAPAANGLSCEFASLLPTAARASTPLVTVAPTTTATGLVPEGTTPIANSQATLMTETAVAPTLTFAIPGKTISATAALAALSEHEPVRPHGISRDEFEAAASFVAALMQTLLPEATPTQGPASEETSISAEGGVAPAAPAQAEVVLSSEAAVPAITNQSPARGSPWNATAAGLPNDRAFPARLPEQAKPALGEGRAENRLSPLPTQVEGEEFPQGGELPSVASFILPNGREFPAEVPAEVTPALGSSRAVPTALPSQARPNVTVERPRPSQPMVETDSLHGDPVARRSEPSTAVSSAGPAPSQSAPVFTVAADGAIELKINLPAPRESSVKGEASAVSPLEVSAELEVPGQAVVRVEATVSEANAFREKTSPVNFAGPRAAGKWDAAAPAEAFERNFVCSGDKRVTLPASASGIAVAKTDGKMPVAPTEEIRTTRNPETFSALPLRADFQVAQSPAERITAVPTELAGQNFAERAVATVTGLAEAQFSASMNKAGSVQLRLKFGGEDLSVRVELRDGAVHTDFRTDSPALREALAKEWQAVAASSPGHLQHFLDPVFSPASVPSTSDAGTQQQASYRQSPQQQAQEQAANRQDGWHSQSPFSRRSALSESFVPEPAAPRVPALLPTSLRLSVLA